MKGLGVGDDAYLVTPAGALVNARVDEIDDDAITLALFTEVRDPAGAFAGKTVGLQYVGRRGVCRVEGVAQRSHVGPTSIRFEPRGGMEVIQRRSFVRVDAVCEVHYHPLGADGWKVETHTLDLSGGGFRLSSPQGIRLGETMSFTIRLDDDGEPVSAIGSAVREADGGTLGIRFDVIDERDRERLIRWVFARERLAIQMTRQG